MSPSGKVYGLRCCKVRRTSSAIELLEPRCLLSGGDPDLTWGGGDGFVTFDSPGADYMWDEPSAMALADDGKMILTGSTQNSNQGRYYATIARVNPDGTLDPTFGNGGMINFRPDTDVFVNAVALAPDGKIVLAGHIMVPYLNGTTPSSQDLLVMRFNSDGSIDTSFGGGDGMFSRDIGASEVDDAKAVAVQPDGKIIVEGSGHGRDYVFTLRLDVDGNLDPSFAGSGIILQKGLAGAQSGGDMILDPDGNIVVAATTNSVYDTSSYTRLLLLRYLPTGALDNSFDGDGKVITDFGVNASSSRILRDPNGKYVVGGFVNGSYALARYNSNGALDTTFGTNTSKAGTTIVTGYYTPVGSHYGLARQNDGKWLFGAGTNNGPNTTSSFNLLRLTENGTPDITFSSNGMRVYAIPGKPGWSALGADLDIAPDGQILFFGEALISDFDFAVYKLSSEGAPPPNSVKLIGQTLWITGTAGDDVVTLSASGSTVTAVLNGQSNVIAGVADLHVDLGDGNDSLTASAGVRGGALILGAGNDSVNFAVNTAVNKLDITAGAGDDTVTYSGYPSFANSTFDGGTGADTLIYNGTSQDDFFNITYGQVKLGDKLAVNFSNLDRMQVRAGAGADYIVVRGATPLGYTLDGEAGDDKFYISNITYYSPYPSFGIIGGAGADLLSLDDRTTPYTGNYTLTPTLLIRDSIYFGYQTIETLNVSAGTQDNKITVTPSATTTFNIDGDLGTYMGGDTITVDLTGVTGTDFSGGPGSGTYTFTNRMPVTFSEIARDLTPWGPTVKSSAFNYNTKQSVNVLFSEAIFGLEVSDLVVKNLTSGQTIDPSSFTLTLAAPSYPTNAEWKANMILPDGQYEARLAAGSCRDATGNLFANDLLLHFFVLSGDVNRDGIVSISDFITVASNFGKTNATFADGDLNYDKQVTIADFIELASHFGQDLAGAASPQAAESIALASADDSAAPLDETSPRSRRTVHHRRHHYSGVKTHLDIYFPTIPGTSPRAIWWAGGG